VDAKKKKTLLIWLEVMAFIIMTPVVVIAGYYFGRKSLKMKLET